MGIQGGVAPLVGNGDVLAVAAALPHGGDGTVGKAADLRPGGGADVNTIVEPLLSLHRVLPVAEIRGEGAHHRGAVIKAQQGLFQAHVVRQVLVGVEDVGQGRRLRRALGCGFRSLRCLIGLCCLRGLCRLGCCRGKTLRTFYVGSRIPLQPFLNRQRQIPEALVCTTRIALLDASTL